MKITILLLSLFITISLCQDYTEITIPTVINITQLSPCTQNYYTFSVPAASRVVTNYLEISFDSSALFDYSLSQNNLTYSEIVTDSLEAGSSTINVVCNFIQVTQWYLVISNVEATPIDLNITIEIPTVAISALAVGTKNTTQRDSYDFSTLVTAADYYSVAFANKPTQYSSLEISIAFNAGQNNSVKSAQVNFNNLPYTGCETSATVFNGEIILSVDYCTLTANSIGSYYISVQPETEEELIYSIQVSNPVVNVVPLTNAITSYLFSETDINFYSIAATANNVLNITLTDIINGEVEVVLSFGNLPFFPCVNGTLPILQETATSSIQLIIDGCNSLSGSYFIGVTANSIDNPSLPVSYRISYSQFPIPSPSTLEESAYSTGTVSQSFYSHYEFDSSSFDVTDDTALNVNLYVDTENLGSTPYQIGLYINFEDLAGPADSCWSNVAQCTINTATQSSCTLQIDPCLFNEYTSWYVSVFGPDGIINSRVIQYSIEAVLNNPTELTLASEIIEASVFYQNYNHYYLPEDLFSLGYQVDIQISAVSLPIELYSFIGGPAGAITCPFPCYNNTDSESITTSALTYPVVSCPNDEITDDFYFSIQGQSLGNYSTYSVLYVLNTGPIIPVTDVAPGDVLIGTIEPLSSINYTLAIPSLDEEDQIVIKLSSQNTSSVLTITLYNTTYLNCIEGYKLYSCTVGSLGYCTFTVPPCVFTTSEGFLITISNSHPTNIVNYNFEFSSDPVPVTTLSNGDVIVSQIGQYQYDLYDYQISGGADTVIIEVVFFDEGTYSATGYLNVSTSPLGTGPCYPYDAEVFTCTSDTKCVYVASSCNIPSEGINIAVYTAYPLFSSLPLQYSIVVLETSAVSPLPAVVNSQSILNSQIYPGQQVYHTFSSQVSTADGSLVAFQLSGDVTGVVSQTTPPNANTCPCFQYYPGAVLAPNGDSPDTYQIEYCNQLASGTYTILVETNSNASPNVQVPYTIIATSFSSVPLELPLGTVLESEVLFGLYQYFKIPLVSDTISLTVTNITGGNVTIYYSSSNPATIDCSEGEVPCTNQDTGCVAQLPACQNIQYISIYGESATSASAITFSILALGQNQTVLTASTPVDGTLNSGFTNIYSFTVPDNIDVPFVTFTLSDISPVDALATIEVITSDLCSSTIITTTLTGSVSIPYCQITNSVLFFYVISQNQITYTAEVTVSDIAANDVTLALATQQVLELTAGQWVTAVYNQPPLSLTSLSSLSFTINSTVSYFSFNTYPAPQCSDATITTGEYTVEPCCVQEGTYYVSFTADADTTVAVEVTSNIISFTNDLTVGTPLTIDVPVLQTAEFQFSIPDLNYQAYTIIVESNNTVIVNYERISQAGTNFCYSTFATCTNVFCFQTLSICDSFIGTVYVSVTSVIADTSVTVSAILTPEVALTIGTTAPFTIQKDIVYVYSISIDQADFLENNQLSVVVTSDSVAVEVILSASGGICSDLPPLESCDNTACTVTAPLCSSTSTYTLLVGAIQSTNITILPTIANLAPIQLTAGEPTNFDGTVNLYEFTLDGTGNLQYVTVSIVYESLTTGFAANWGYFTPAPFGIYCLPSTAVNNYCLGNYVENEATTTTTCTFTIEPCQLYTGSFLIQVTPVSDADVYSISYNVAAATVQNITLGQTIYGTVNNFENIYYQLPFDRSTILPGQSFEIILEATCGDVDLYINQGALAGPSCFLSENTSYILSACDLLESSQTSSPDSDFLITVAGGEPLYEQYNVPSSYSLSSSISGSKVSFVPIAPNTNITFDGSQTIYTYNVAGITDFTGQLAFTLSVLSEETDTSSIYISSDTPYYPNVLECTDDFTELSVDGLISNVIYFDSCNVDEVRIYYISFDPASSNGSSFIITRTKQFVRDLNEYPYYPQSGAVVGQPVSFNITDEEYFEIEVNPNNTAFRFQATLITPEIGWANLLADLTAQPSFCDINTAITCTTENTQNNECQVNIDYCQFDLTDPVPTVYLTVNSENPSSVPVPYNLTVVQTVNQTQLALQSGVCGSSESDWSWYFLPVQTKANTFYEFQVYSVSLNEQVSVYLNTQGLATNNCFELSNTTCSQACSLLYTCNFPANGQISLGVQRNGASSYFVQVNPITVTVQPLTIGTPHDSSNDTPSNLQNANYYFYSFQTPAVTANQIFVLTVASETSVTVSYNSNSLTIDCFEEQSSGTIVSFFVNSCDYAAGVPVYVTVTGSSQFEIEAAILPTPVTPLLLNANVEGILSVNSANISKPSFAAYSFSLQATDISTYESFSLTVYGVNYGTISVWITENQIADNLCAISTFPPNTETTITLNSCELAAGTYIVNVLLLTQTSSCLPVTYGIVLIPNSPATPYNYVTLTSGVASTNNIFFTNNVYQFTPTNPTTSLVTITATSSELINLFNGCVPLISTPVSYFFGCSAQPSYSLTVIPLVSSSTVPGSTYQITATTSTIPVISENPTNGVISNDYETTLFYTFTVTTGESIEIIVDLTVGPSVLVQIWSSQCEEGANVLLDDFTCYFGTCVVPISQRQGVILNDTAPLAYYVTVSGFSPSAFSISVAQGEEETCSTPDSDEFKFCTIVDWPVWTYESDEANIISAQDQTAEANFNYLYSKFCPPCTCEELSEECNTSLIEYVCTQTFRACDYDGFITSICYTSCFDVETNCGNTFEGIGLPELSCNHNFYLAEDDTICTEIYGVSGSGNEYIIWIIVGVVLFIVVVVLLSVVVVIIYKQLQAKKRASSYEVLE